MDIDDVLTRMGIASQGMGLIIGRLQQRVDRASGGERRSIQLRLPTMRSDWRDLQAEIQSMIAERDSFPLPSEAVLATLSTAVTNLSARIAGAQTTEALFGLATQVATAVASVKAGAKLA